MTPNLFARLGILAAIAPAGLAAQTFTRASEPGNAGAAALVQATPGASYRAGGMQRMVLGTGYRAQWQTPVHVEMLDLARFGGGLTPTRTGGDFSTRSLRFRGADGREYVFRSLDKDATQGLHPHLKNTLVDRVVQDQVSSALPGAVLVASALQTAAGVLHAPPRLVVMPDDAALGQFRGDFAGMLGTIEERPGGESGPVFAESAVVEGTNDMLAALAGGHAHRVDARAYLNARLLDLVMGDWDRHDGQWRWARFDEGGAHVWRPIARDRDNAFSRHGGWVAAVGRTQFPKMVHFDSAMAGVRGLTDNAQNLDRRLLSGLTRTDWDAAVAALRGRLTDDVIDGAVRRLPAEIHAQVGAELAGTVRARRDALPAAAEAFYHQLAFVVDVHGTDAADRATIEREADGSATVSLYPAGGSEPSFQRHFKAGETREVRVHLAGGDDQATVLGQGQPRVLVRVVGGAGDDTLADQGSTEGGVRTVLHDSDGNNRLNGARVDTRPYTPAPHAASFDNPEAPLDRGVSKGYAPYATLNGDVGVVLGATHTRTRQGFRREGFAQQDRFRLEWAPGEMGFAADFRSVNQRVNGNRLTLHARASQIDPFRFHGWGNDSGNELSRSRYLVDQTRVTAEAEQSWPLAAGMRLGVGPTVRYRSASADENTPFELAQPRGADAYTTAGLRSALEWDRRDAARFPTRGFRVRAAGEANQGLSGDVDGTYARAQGEGAVYVPVVRGNTLALRAGGERVWGDYPVQEAAFLGGGESLRGYSRDRFAGDASVYGNAELRSSLGTANLGVARGNLGVIALADAGRVYFNGSSQGDWHTTVGGGLWFSLLDHAYTGTVIVARGDDGTRTYLKFGLPF
jgi:hypothetical protein